MQAIQTDKWFCERLELFLLRPEHVTQAYVDWLMDTEVNRFLESRYVHHDLASTQKYVDQILASGADLMCGIRLRDTTRRHIGNIKLGPIDRNHGRAEIGILIGDKTSWGCGFASEAISIVSRIAFEELKMRKLTAGCYSSNRASQAAFEKAGFFVEGRRERHFIAGDATEGLVLLARFNPVLNIPATESQLRGVKS